MAWLKVAGDMMDELEKIEKLLHDAVWKQSGYASLADGAGRTTSTRADQGGGWLPFERHSFKISVNWKRSEQQQMYSGTKSIWLIPIAVVLMAYANVVLKLRIAALGGGSSVSWLSYILSMMLDPWTWSALIAAVVTGLLYVIALRQLELSVVEPLFALVFVLVPLAAVLFLGEHLPPLRIVGLVLIFIGVILVGQTS